LLAVCSASAALTMGSKKLGVVIDVIELLLELALAV